MEDELSMSKSTFLDLRRKKRDKNNPSILDSFPKVQDKPEPAKPKTAGDKLKKCPSCDGSKKIEGLFRSFECAVCEGTGYDLSDHVNIIKYQQQCMDWAKTRITALQVELRNARMTDEERELLKASSVRKFYEGCNRKD
ncbi:hypothetical protein [Vibrio marisflavi]|uniref:Uncharacterized protein n=1 Tax=Vibrio marisflavi CECT 7928 TaxID=634439 RepID=A0ABN8E978_9VIBR|nr:hypothetical protein [Vibrio marisflavi]CAH0543142.1 hypothetical protein VMF7928_04421 [Vibrio marisflavi CECT 7928]